MSARAEGKCPIKSMFARRLWFVMFSCIAMVGVIAGAPRALEHIRLDT